VGSFPGYILKIQFLYKGNLASANFRKVLTLDQTLESFLRGHVEAFQTLGGSARTSVYDNLKTAVLERQGTVTRFHPRLLELAGHNRAPHK